MAYGILKVDTVTFTNAGVDKSITLSGLVQNPVFSGNVTVTGTLSGVTVTGTTANFTSGNFTNISGGTHTITSGVFAAGSAASPSITFTGDLNTGIYSPGADQVAISTGGSGRLFVDASGRLGVGTSSPSFPIESKVTGLDSTIWGYNVAQFADATANNTGLRIGTNTSTSGLTQLIAATNSAASQFGFWTYNGSAWGERMRLDSSGRLGVGTSAPSELLTINGATPAALVRTSNAAGSAQVKFNADDTNYAGIGLENTSLVLRCSNSSTPTSRVTITNGGLVGIGTSSPASLLNIKGSAANGFSLTHSNNTVISELYELSGTQGAGLSLKNSSGTTNVFFNAGGDSYINGGKVGIGTTSPTANRKLTLKSGGGDAGLSIVNTADDVVGLFVPENTTTSQELGIYSLSNMRLYTGGTQRTTIDTSGRLLVGTSSSRQVNASIAALQLQIEGTTYQSSSMSLVTNQNAADGSYIVLGKSRGTSLGSSTIVNSGDSLGALWFCGADGNTMPRSVVIEAFVDATPGANDMPGRLVFSTTADGASSPTERMRISQNGNTLWRSDGTTSTHDLGNSNTSITGEVVTFSAYRNTVNDTFRFLTCVRQGFAVALEIRDDGDIYNVNGTYGSLSDAKLKENIVDANSQWDDIKQLRVRNYNFKPETNNSTHKQIGVIAQEIEDVSPGLVNTVPDRDAEGNDLGTVTKSVNYSVLYMKAVKALQEAMERIELLEARLDAANL